MANQERLLAAAVAAMLREGRQVPMASIARDAGVGVGTLYRNYPTREALLAALTQRSFELVHTIVEDVLASAGPAIAGVEEFLLRTIAHRDQLVLPLHGGPVAVSHEAQELRAQISADIGRILERGRCDRTIRADVTSDDVIFFGALLAQPLSDDESWMGMNLIRQARVFLSGLAPSAPELDDATSELFGS
ncbi:TetR/AcrR family transcriptional regulator [Brevibacterium sp. S111]|uniref:TetR/AcrR family transcriptional regulator n=1 Tax=Brevibacterium sp. S111 TaxID=2483795 RepID=UPI00196AD563|nr:TetR/AcrR family transcriptional regulator [Brevibacterium sp. S111]